MEYNRRCSEALSKFVDGSRSWLSVDRRHGAAAVAAGWSDVADGSITPDVGVVASHHPPVSDADDAG